MVHVQNGEFQLESGSKRLQDMEKADRIRAARHGNTEAGAGLHQMVFPRVGDNFALEWNRNRHQLPPPHRKLLLSSYAGGPFQCETGTRTTQENSHGLSP